MAAKKRKSAKKKSAKKSGGHSKALAHKVSKLETRVKHVEHFLRKASAA